MKKTLICLLVLSLFTTPLYASPAKKTMTLQIIGGVMILSGAICMASGFSMETYRQTYVEKELFTDIYVYNTGEVIPESYVYVEKTSTSKRVKNSTVGFIGIGLVVGGIATHHLAKDLRIDILNDEAIIKYDIKF